MKTILVILGTEVLLFFGAVLFHLGLGGDRYRHREAFIAESVIGTVLLAGWIAAALSPSHLRPVSIGVQSFALFGTAVGLFTIAIGVGPRTAPDLALHACMILLLSIGLVAAFRLA